MFYPEIREVMEKILQYHNIDCSLKHYYWHKHPVSYSFKNNTITYCQPALDTIYKHFKEIPITEFISFVTYHELGHYRDYRINPDKVKHKEEILSTKNQTLIKELRQQLEQSAWKYGAELVPDEQKEMFNQFREKYIRLTK